MPPFRFTLPIVTPSRRRSAGGAARGVTTRLVVALALALLSLPVVGGSALADGSEDGQNQGRDKALVCKYVGNPGQDERLKGGKNPIEVGNPSVDQGYFNDAHGRSYVLSAEQTECPPGDDGGGEEPQFDPYEVTVWWSFDNPPAQWPQTRTEDPGEVPARACEAAGYQYDAYWIRDEGDEDYLAHLQHLNSPADDARLDPHDYGLRRTTADPGLCPQDDLSVSKTAIPSYDRDYDWTITKDVDTDHRDITPDEKASFDYTVTATPAHRDSSFRVAGTITVTNPNSETVTATISDKIEDGPTCAVNASDVSDAEGTQVNVPADGADYDYTCTMPQTTTASTDGTNTVSLAWNTHDHPGTSGHADASTSFDFADATVHTTHRYVTVTDNQHQLSNNHLDATDGKRTFTYTKKFPGEDGTCTDYDNTATLQQRLRGAQGPQGDQGPRSGESTLSEPIATASKTVTVCVQKALTVTKTAQASYDRTYDWTIDKDVDRTKATIDKGDSADFDYTVTATPNGFDDSGWELSGAITVTNPNAERVGAITADVTDQVSIEGVTCTVDGGTGVTIPAGGTKKLSYTCETGELDPSDYTGHTNTATVTWDGGERSATGSTQVVFHPDVETDDTIPIFDDKVTHTGDPKKLGTATWNANGTPRAFHYTLTQTGVAGQCTDYTNTALANHLSSRLLPDSLTGTDTAGTDALPPRLDDPYSASQTVTVCVRQPVLISRTDESTFDRTYDWKITKEVDKTTAQVTGPDTARFTYTVTATPVGRTDSNEQLGGVITLTNPNTFAGGEITTDVTQTPDLGEGITCSVVDGSGVVVPAGESVEVRYTCTREKNADLSLDPATERDRTIEVYDDQVSHADDPVKLGPAEWNAEGTPTEFTYTLDLAGTPDGCADRTNTAFVPDRELKAAATVRVCSSPEQAPVELPQAAPPVAGLVTGPVVEPSAESLPSTGAPSGEGGLLTLGFGALLVGGWLVLSGRRRARRY